MGAEEKREGLEIFGEEGPEMGRGFWGGEGISMRWQMKSWPLDGKMR